MAIFRRRKEASPPIDTTPPPDPAAGAGAEVPQPAVRVLVVDDDDDVRFVMTASLAREGFEVVGAAADGDEALELAAARAPDIVLLDLHMPDLGGLALLPRLRERAPEAKVVICSSITASHMLEASMEAGATGFIVKGVSGRSIGEHLRRVAASGRAKLVRPYPLNRDY